MKIKLQLTHLAGGREVVFEAERGERRVPQARLDAEDLRAAGEAECRYRMALEAIKHSPESADEIAGDALEW